MKYMISKELAEQAWKLLNEGKEDFSIIEKSVETNKCSLEMTTDIHGNIIHRWMRISNPEILKQKQNFSDSIESFIRNNFTQSTPITVLKHIPDILLRYTDMEDNPLQITSKILRKILLPADKKRSHKHNIPKAILKDLPVQLYKPIGIYKQNDNGHIIVLTEHVIGKNPVICAIEINKTIDKNGEAYGISFRSHHKDNINIEIWAENNQLKNEIYEQLRLYITGSFSEELAQKYSFFAPVIFDASFQGHRSNNYNFDFDIALSGAHISFDVNYCLEQILIDTDVTEISGELITEVINHVKS